MHVLLFLGGLISLAAGGVAFGFAVIAFRQGQESVLMVAGAVGIIGGLALLGLGSIALRLSRLVETLEAQPIPRSVATLPSDLPAKAEVTSVEAAKGAPAPEAPRAEPPPARPAPAVSLDTPLGAPPVTVEPTLRVSPSAQLGANEALALRVEPLSPRMESATRLEPGALRDPLPLPVAIARGSGAVTATRGNGHDEAPRALKSGVIEGMAYTLYSNGAVDAELPRQGTMRFASIAEWRAYIRAEA